MIFTKVESVNTGGKTDPPPTCHLEKTETTVTLAFTLVGQCRVDYSHIFMKQAHAMHRNINIPLQTLTIAVFQIPHFAAV